MIAGASRGRPSSLIDFVAFDMHSSNPSSVNVVFSPSMSTCSTSSLPAFWPTMNVIVTFAVGRLPPMHAASFGVFSAIFSRSAGNPK